ncbi:MAG TPA: N(4)-(beta-N-acetylglucosaminyl)-L-asparaginase [Chitinophagales bacterium]|nr:N(4)-(beta-N-acetylglucosaminyl)-L-asparaginase [Chitinophagales bacterium]
MMAPTPLVIATWNNLKATEAGRQVLAKNGPALDAVEATAKVPEADPDNMTVGYGGHPDRDGNVTLDACVMDHLGNAGSVTYLQHIMHPVSVARKVMEKTPHVMLSGDGALQFALKEGFKKQSLLTDKARARWEEWKLQSKYEPVVNIELHDTIGILALDAQGNLAGACSTSGLAYKIPGRVGDSPIIGAGLFVDNAVGAACATGYGELAMKSLGSFLIVELMRQGKTPQQACEEAINRVAAKYDCSGKQLAFLAVNKTGAIGAYSLQQGFSYSLGNNAGNHIFESGYYS